MKILCELISRQTYKPLTSVEMEVEAFGLSRENPFPASELWTASFCCQSMKVTYIVAEALGDLGSWEPEARAA